MPTWEMCRKMPEVYLQGHKTIPKLRLPIPQYQYPTALLENAQKNRKMMEQAPSCTQIRTFPSGTFLIDSLATVGGPRMPRSKRLLTLVQRLKKNDQMRCKCIKKRSNPAVAHRVGLKCQRRAVLIGCGLSPVALRSSLKS